MKPFRTKNDDAGIIINYDNNNNKIRAHAQLAGELKGPGRWCPLMAWDWPLPGNAIGRSFFWTGH